MECLTRLCNLLPNPSVKRQGLQVRVLQSQLVVMDINEGKNYSCIVDPGYADPNGMDIRRDFPTAVAGAQRIPEK